MSREPLPFPEPARSPDEPFVVGAWRVEPLALRLRHQDGREARLEPRVMSLLVRLAGAEGRPVTHETLVASVWDGAYVSADAVHGAVGKLRRALEQGEPAGSAIETIPRVGYRLRLPVWRGEPGPAATPRPLAPSPSGAEPGPTPRVPGRRVVLGMFAAAVLVALAAALVALVVRGRTARSNATVAGPVLRPLTSFPGLEIEPAFAPTGDRVAFAWRGPEQAQWDVYVTVVGGSAPPLRLTTDPAPDRHPAWSPDATRLAFVRATGEGCGLWSVAALGGDERRLGPCRDVADLAFAPDGRTLFFTDRAAEDAPYAVHALDLESGAVRLLTDPPRGGMGDRGLAPAPDGRSVAILRSPVLGIEDLWRLDFEGGLRRLSFDDLKIHGFDWTPDGRALVVSSNRGGLFSLWRFPADGAAPVWLGASGGDLDSPTVGAGGRRVAFEQWQEDTNLYRLALADLAQAKPLVVSTRWDFQPALSPDGARLAFVSDRSGSSELWTASADGSSPYQRTRFRGPLLTSPHWAPDGSRIVFDLRAGGNGDLWVLETDAAMPRRLTETPANELAPSFARDGRSVLFASDRSGSWELWRMDVASGEASAVTTGGGYRGFETADGAVVFSRADRPGLWVWRASDGPAPLVDDLAPVDRANWAVAGGTVVYVSRPVPDRPQLVRVDLSTRERRVLGLLPEFPFQSGIALAPGLDSVILSRTDRRESDLYWIELPASP